MDRRQVRMNMENLSTSELKREIEKQHTLKGVLQESCKHWTEIIEELKDGIEIERGVELDGTWKTRYAYQFLHNRMLRQQIKEMRSELRMLKNGQLKFPADIDWDNITPAECRRHIKALQVEITCQRGLIKSTEEKLDSESFAYNTSRDQCEGILNDVWFQQQSRIRDQEEQERQTFDQYRELRGKHIVDKEKIKLPPITPKPISRHDSYKSAFDLVRARKQKENKQAKKKRRSVTFLLDNT